MNEDVEIICLPQGKLYLPVDNFDFELKTASYMQKLRDVGHRVGRRAIKTMKAGEQSIELASGYFSHRFAPIPENIGGERDEDDAVDINATYLYAAYEFGARAYENKAIDSIDSLDPETQRDFYQRLIYESVGYICIARCLLEKPYKSPIRNITSTSVGEIIAIMRYSPDNILAARISANGSLLYLESKNTDI